ncbi:MAG: AAA family ATPase, partial [Elusimicrobiota bacterium]|nr:AAA family ATPase [Elusimicrobiota bacterium]
MIIEKTAARKSLAVTLALALFASAPVNAWSQTQAAAARAGNGAGVLGTVGAMGTMTPNMSAVMAPIALPNLSLNVPTPAVAPALTAMAAAPVAAAAAPSLAAQPLALEAHPVIGVLNALQAKGVQLPETLTTREDAAKLIVAAQAMPEGTAKQNMIAMAAAINAANNTGSSAQLGRIFDAEQARAEAPEAAPVQAGGWRSVVSRLLPSTLAKMVAKKAPEAAPVPVAQPADPADFAVKLEDLHYAPAAAQLPENTSKIPVSDKQVVGQDAGLKAIKFGLQMPGRHYNLFVAGPDGSGRETALRHMLPEVAGKMATPGDRVAVTNFQDKENPLVLNLETGRGPAFVKGVRKFVATLKAVLPEQLGSGQIGEAKKQAVAQVEAAAAEREEAFKAEVAAITLAGGVFTVEFFAKPSGEGRVMVGLKLMRDGRAVDPSAVDADVAAGAYTRAQFDQANKERDRKFPEVMEKFKAMMEQTNKEMEAVQEQLAELESKAVASIVSQVAQPLLSLVMPETKASPEMDALQEKVEAWSADFEKRVSALSIEGFGVAFIQNGNKLQVAYTHGGEPLSQNKVEELMKAGLSQVDLKRIQLQLASAVKPLLEEFKAKNQEFGKAQQELAKSQPKSAPTPEQMKAVGYVKMLMQFSASNYQIFMGKIGSSSDEEGIKDAPGQKPMDAEDFFEASVLSGNGGKTGAPVVWVKNPTLDKVFGKADDNRRTMIIPGVGLVKGGAPGGPTLIGGAIQQAEGGFLVMDFMDVLRAPGLYQALMAAAKTGEASMVEGGLQSLMNGKNESYHVPSKVKIVLIGSPSLRMMVARQDPDFALNFQASADFESSLKVSEESVAGYVQFFKKAVLTLAAELKQDVTNLTQDAMSALVEQGARMADSNKKLTAQFGALYGVVREATYWAREAGRTEVRREDVDTALQTKQDREEVYRRHLLQVYKDNVFVVETEGKKVGQINGLAVMGTFGVPMRITVVPSAAAGAGGIISVDRQAGPSQTGSSFNKALGVVEGFLQNLFAQKRPFPARLSISYEQNYGGIDGDSATSTEIYSILSALSGVGIGQNFAVTGSADQFGNV